MADNAAYGKDCVSSEYIRNTPKKEHVEKWDVCYNPSLVLGMPRSSKATLERVIARQRQAIHQYYALSGGVGIVTLAMLVLVNFPSIFKGLLGNQPQGNLIAAFIGSLSLPSFNEIQKRKDRIFRLQLLAEEYDCKLLLTDSSPDDWESRCERAIEEVLKS